MVQKEKGYVIAIADGSEFYIPNALHIERDDNCIPLIFDNDTEASKGAELDGVKLIYGMEHVPDGVYIDTSENRDTIREMLETYPAYKEIVQSESMEMTMGGL